MWGYLTFIPDSILAFVLQAICIGGAGLFILGHLTKWIPLMGRYSLVSRLIGLLLLLPGLYLYGGYGVEMEYRETAKVWKQKLEEYDAKSREVNIQIEEKIVKETKVIKEDTEETKALIESMKAQINNSQCVIGPEFRELYNKGITGNGQ